MFGVNEGILILFAATFAFGLLTLDFSIFERLKRVLAENIATKCGLYDVYFDQCYHENLELIRALRHYEGAYCESLVDLVAETLSLPEMLLILGTAKIEQGLKRPSVFPNLTAQAQTIAHFYIDVARHSLWQASPPSGPHAQRLCSRWRRRSS